MTLTVADIDDRFLVGDGCWPWVGTTDPRGYGRTHGLWAHRVVFELLAGPIPAGMDLDHVCRNVNCVRPDHLDPVPRRTNLLRGETIAARNAAKTHCPQGHEYTEENTRVSKRNQRNCKTCDRASARRRRGFGS